MKNILKYTGALILGLGMASCDFLDVEPKVLAPETFYESASEVEYGIVGVYGALNNEQIYGNYYSLMISGVDDLTYYNRDITSSAPYWLNHSTTDSYIYGCWTTIYAGIKNANEYMEAMESVRETLDADMKYYTEARFLRAYYYFLLAQAWGDVPLHTRAIKSPSEVQKAATPQADVLKWVVAEMEECLEVMTDPSLEVAPYRVTRSAVQGILARVYLFMAGESVSGFDSQAMYANAARCAKAVIDSGLHRLNDDYSQVFINMIGDKYDTDFRESIWEADFYGYRTGSDAWSNGRIGDLIGIQCTASDNKYSEWACNYSYGMYNGSLKLWDLYWSEDRTDDEKEIQSKITDLRQVWNMANYNYSGNKNLNLTAGYDKTPYMYENKSSFEYPTAGAGQRNASKWRRETVYEAQQTAKHLYTAINFPILRYSDVLLMYAEAVNESSDTGAAEAYDYVKMVRDRAGIATRDKGEYASQAAMRQLVRNERGRELCFEALRKYDLIRWGVYEREMQLYTRWQGDDRWSKNTLSARAGALGSNIQPKHVYLPVPATELGVNKLLKQNPLW